nr:retinol dehydrogenase 12-like isoform X1 [Parasteatoda tepidariorum]
MCDSSTNRPAGSNRILVYLKDFFSSKKCQSTASFQNKIVIITGGNAGIGKETALDLAKRGAKVIIACRDTRKGEEAAQDIKEKEPSAAIQVEQLDLSSFASIRKFAENILQTEQRIHILINNAGVASCPKSLTEDGFEMQFGVNHLGHFLLTNLLLERLKVSAPARIVNVSSIAHIYGKINFNDINLDRNYEPLAAYCRSKLANILFTRELAKRLEGTDVTTYCLHPGAVHTGLGRHLNTSVNKFIGHIYEGCSKLFWKNARNGAQTSIYCAVEESLENQSGYYYWYVFYDLVFSYFSSSCSLAIVIICVVPGLTMPCNE